MRDIYLLFFNFTCMISIPSNLFGESNGTIRSGGDCIVCLDSGSHYSVMLGCGHEA
jgi:hypothetical protein